LLDPIYLLVEEVLGLDRYSCWIPSMGRNTADSMDEALD
jgi:hypothetical protein